MNKPNLIGAAFLLLGVFACGSSNPISMEDSSPGGVTSTGGATVPAGAADAGGVDGTGGTTLTGGTTSAGGHTLGVAGNSGAGGFTTGANSSDAGSSGTGGSTSVVCGGFAGLPCPSGQFCEYANGTCSGIADATGFCRNRPSLCPTVYQPVCGCDGKTYGNDCERRSAGASKRSDGECLDNSGKLCGGIAGFACAKGQFCDLTPGDCGTIADGAGTCSPTGSGIACDKIYRPVCGCDNRTYGNDCERQVAGVSKKADGACATETKLCGGIAGFACAKGQFCDLAPGDCGTIADGAGTCSPTGSGIACADIYRPVCGCDGKTYGNDCERQVAGVSKRSDGACTMGGKLCAGIAGLACDKGQFCDLAPGDCGTIADGAGQCVTMGAVACPAIYKPVCGCNGKTYGSDCDRQAMGVSKLSDGACRF